jgi:hypothetical protein
MFLTLSLSAIGLWFYFDRKDAKQCNKAEISTNTALYCIKVIDSCKTLEQLHVANQLVKNCLNKNMITLNDYHRLIKKIWSMQNAI